MIAIILIYLSLIFNVSAEDDHCKYFTYCGNAAQSSTSKSQPSAATSANFNPSNISNIKGLGVETLFQPNNSLGFNLVTGNGKVGGALITPTAENSFFGNRSIEIEEDYAQRRAEKLRYKSNKINLALGAKIINKKNFAFDMGISVKRNSTVGKINPGLGFSSRLLFLNFGAYIYKDDTHLLLKGTNLRTGQLYVDQYGTDFYTESFTAMTASVGTQIGSLSLDAGIIKSKYNFYENETFIKIYSSSYQYKSFLFNLAMRDEESDNVNEEDGVLTLERKKMFYYGGVQYLWNKHIKTGVAFNQFLVNDISFTLTLFL